MLFRSEPPLNPDDDPSVDLWDPYGPKWYLRDLQFVLDIELVSFPRRFDITSQPPALRELKSEVGTPQIHPRVGKAQKTFVGQGPAVPVPYPGPQAGIGDATYTNTNPGR